MVKLLLWKKTDIIGTLLHTLDLCLHILHWYTVLIFGTYLACSSSTQTSGGCSGKARETLSSVSSSNLLILVQCRQGMMGRLMAAADMVTLGPEAEAAEVAVGVGTLDTKTGVEVGVGTLDTAP